MREKIYVLTCSMIAGSIWHATVRDQIRVYSFMESSSSTPMSVAENRREKFLYLIRCNSPAEGNVKDTNFALQTQIKNQPDKVS